MIVIRKLTIIACFLFPIVNQAQIGIRVSFEQASYDDYSEVSQKSSLLKNQYSAGIEYWFRMKNVRVEFFPEIYFLRANDSNYEGLTNISYTVNGLGLLAKTHFYIMDFFGDCDCPTFSKQGNFFTKGFYVAIAPGMQMDMQSLHLEDENLVKQSNNLHFKVNLGAGLDIGIMDKWTISPFLFYNVTPMLAWKEFGISHDPLNASRDEDKSIQRAVQTGIRVHYRWDY
jgi:hypothetical protein